MEFRCHKPTITGNSSGVERPTLQIGTSFRVVVPFYYFPAYKIISSSAISPSLIKVSMWMFNEKLNIEFKILLSFFVLLTLVLILIEKRLNNLKFSYCK
jgi:xanthine/uracil/vitamin C permease (AzgA family)